MKFLALLLYRSHVSFSNLVLNRPPRRPSVLSSYHKFSSNPVSLLNGTKTSLHTAHKQKSMHLATPFTLALTALPTILAYSGDMTYYTPGMGSCGIASSPDDDVVALAVPMMQNGANPNANPRCGSKIGIWIPRTHQKHEATVVDTCQACALHDIDVSPSLFKKVAPDGDGKVHGIAWGGNRVGG